MDSHAKGCDRGEAERDERDKGRIGHLVGAPDFVVVVLGGSEVAMFTCAWLPGGFCFDVLSHLVADFQECTRGLDPGQLFDQGTQTV